MDKRILVPTDFSKNALNAVRYALDLYKKINCEFYLLNVFRLDSYTTSNLLVPEPGSTEYENAKAKSEEEFAKLLEMIALHQDNYKHTFYTISSYNFLSEALEQTIATKDIDLVIMGTQGASGTKGVIFGSNTVNTMEKVRECPVLAIPEKVQFTAPKEIVFPTDFKSRYKRTELKYLLEIAKIHQAIIRVIYVNKNMDLNETQENNKQLLKEILETVDHSFHTIPKKDVAQGITSFADLRKSDMIAFINRKHFFFGSIFSRPLVKEIGYKASIPILALH
ncbi:MAG: universal stress protein [Arenibacter latericius]|nr:universal stress protein [Arenibacter latericius]